MGLGGTFAHVLSYAHRARSVLNPARNRAGRREQWTRARLE
ncbi:hypothetical protein [Paenibacillus thiaminolyticus]|nr:hypothetical protein [Paenibacillus thiaminolyticus]